MRLLLPHSLALASAVVLVPTAGRAQEVVQALPGTTDADRLADTMRRLAISPTDLGALLEAGELSLRIDDLSGAASLFARADRVDPRSARAKAGMAAILVRAERPGEALRYFDQASSYGIPPERIAGDRGLAYDLIGQNERAQRDYRLAVKAGLADDELLRRYALSLGIAGRREQALAVLEPLVRRQDRGAWRARAFILAMTGDVAGASTIAATVMPPGMAQGLAPFFQRLPLLGPIDRAFAVHFGEVRATPERLADARLVPVLGPLPPEATPPVALAAVQPGQAPDIRRRRRDRRSAPNGSATMASAQPVAAPVQALPSAAAVSRPGPKAAATRPDVQAASTAPVQIAMARPPVPVATPRRASRHAEAVAVSALSRQPLPQDGSGTAASYRPATPAGPPPSSAAPVSSLPAPVTSAAREANTIVASGRPATPLPGFDTGLSAAVPATAPIATTLVTPVSVVAGGQATPAGPTSVAETAGVSVATAESTSAPVTIAASAPAFAAPDSVLARIIANLSVPGAELDVAATAPPVRAAPVPPTSPEAAARVVAVAREKTARDVAASRTAERIERAREPLARFAELPRANRQALAVKLAAGTRLSAEEAAVLLGRAKPDAATWTPSRNERRGLANAVEAGRPLTRSQQRVVAAAVDTRAPVRVSRNGDEPPGRSATGRDRRAVATKVAAGTPLSAAEREALGIADVDPATTPPTRAERRRLSDLVRSGATLTRTQQRDLAALGAERKSATEPGRRGKDIDRGEAHDETRRIWVQVATGAREGDLAKAWTAVRDKAPDAFKGRSGYATPLRATNRVVTGPFKTREEAQAFVNGLAKKGVSASTFTSDAGQKVAKLPARQ